ncbi:MAG: BrnT family toxin [Treponema sp.]|nr:BrnT family toxin [Treponema sp.]
MELRFEWDENKNAINIRKHGVSFEEAAMVFSDRSRYEMYDKIHSLIEKRWIVIGIAGWKVLKVSFTERNGVTRIILARKADKNETEEYYYGYSKKNN